MCSVCDRALTLTSGWNDHYRKKLAIVTNGYQREDRAMTTTTAKRAAKPTARPAARPARHRVATVLVDSMTAFEPAIAAEFFGMDRSTDFGVDWYRHAF